MKKINFVNKPNTDTPINDTNLNQMQDNIEEAISEVVESGSNDNGSYVKYADGTMICHARKTITATIHYSWNNLFTSNSQEALTYPIEFIERPILSFEVESAFTSWKMFEGVGTNKMTPRYYIVCANNTEEAAYFDVEYIAIGKWK